MRRGKKRIIIWLSFRGLIKAAVFMALAVTVALAFVYELPSTKTWTEWTLPLSGRIIAIDAGHGGPDGGAVSRQGVIEKDINLAIALYLRDYLQQAGALVVMTREEDTDLADTDTKGYSKRKTQDLIRRAEFVQNKKSDLLISIHLNSIPSERWSGAQTFYYPSLDGNKQLATFIQNEIKRNLVNTNREVQTLKTNYLLKAMQIPSALIEVGFLSNPAEAEQLASDAYQKKVAAAVYNGILRYCSGEKVS